MLENAISSAYSWKLMFRFPNLATIIWIMLVIDFFQNVLISGMFTTILTILMEMFKISHRCTIFITYSLIFIRGLSYLVGSWLADSYFGKYNIYVMSITLISLILNPIMCIATVHSLFTLEQQKVIFIVSLYIYNTLNFGKECALPLYSEQFYLPEEERELRTFYIITFWLKNFSQLIGTVITPKIVKNTECFNSKCFAIPFFTSLITDFIYLIIIVLCKNKFKHRKITFKIVEKHIHLVLHAILRKLRTKKNPPERRRPHFLDYADDIYDRSTIKDAKRICYLLSFFFSFLTFWITELQLKIMRIIHATYFKSEYYLYLFSPQQIIPIYTLLIIIFTPITYMFIPFLTKRRSAYLKWIGAGFILMCLTSFISVKEYLESRKLRHSLNEAHFHIYNTQSLPIQLDCQWTGKITLSPFEVKDIHHLHINKVELKPISIEIANVSLWKGNLESIQGESASYIVKENEVIKIKAPDSQVLIPLETIVYFICGKQSCSDYNIKLSSSSYFWEETKRAPQINETTIFTLKFSGKYKIFINNSEKINTIFESNKIYSIILLDNSRTDTILKVHSVTRPHLIGHYWVVLLHSSIFALGETFSWVSLNMFIYTQSPVNLRASSRSLHLIGQSFGSTLLATSVIFLDYYIMFLISLAVFSLLLLMLYIYLCKQYKLKIPTDH